MGKNFSVEVRTHCKICGKKLPNRRYRTYCSDVCRNARNNAKQKEKGYNVEWQRKKRDAEALKPDPNKVQCLICSKWYVQVCSHVQQIHGMTGREYREYFNLEVKRGVVPKWYRKMKGEQAIENGTVKNLDKGVKFRFKKGQKGVGVYERSTITKDRLRTLNKLRKGLD